MLTASETARVTTRFTAKVFIAVSLSFTCQALAQNVGSVFPILTSKVDLGGSEMRILSSVGAFEDVIGASFVRSIDFRIDKDLLTLRLYKSSGSIQEVVFVIRETRTNECGAVEYLATPRKRLSSSYALTLIDPAKGCQTENTKLVLQRSLGMTNMLDGQIEMESAVIAPF